ncbi:MAG: division/cell wall cluster transcriptional repressor MraZ [Bacillota bacterium]
MFMGEYQHTLDQKDRLIIPAKFREELGDIFIVTRGLDNCLFVYPKKGWEVVEEKIKDLSMTRSDVRAFVRLLLSGAVECEVDKQGRIIIPENLREHARINKDVFVIGVSTRVEIWSKENWEQYANRAEQSYEEIAEKIVDLGI